MRRKNERISDDADRVVKDIKRQTRRRFSAEEKIRIVLVGLRGDDSKLNEHGNIRPTFVTELLRRSLYAGLITIPKWGLRTIPACMSP